MTYSFYSYGGGELLWKVLNGVAMMFKANSPYANIMLSLFTALGCVCLALKAMFHQQAGIWLKNWAIGVTVFIILGLTPKTSLHIIDEVSPSHKYSKVDNIPLFMAFTFHTASTFSKSVTDHLEGLLIPVEACQYGKTGGMFGARLAKKMRSIHVRDPVLHQNLKDFVQQCFTLPFVLTNMTPGKTEALKTTDILGMIEANPHHWLGSYWRLENGQTEFQYCKDGAKQARKVLSAELPVGILGLASDLFGIPKDDGIRVTSRLKGYFSGGWESLGGMASSLNEALGQSMMMNAYFEGNDDKREEFGIARRHSDLIAMSSMRGQAQQGFGSIIGGDMMQDILPLAHGVMICFLSVIFLFIAPMALVTGGMGTLWLWVKLVLWVESWPIFFVAINGMSLMVLPQRTAFYQDMGGGLSLMSQQGVYDAAWQCYAIFQWLLTLIMTLSWSVVSGSLQSVATALDGMNRSSQGIASKLGSDLTDGNLNVDNQSMHNKTVASTQLAQQQLGPSFSFGERYDDGRFTITRGTDGDSVIQEAKSNLRTSMTDTTNWSSALSQESHKALELSHQQSQQAVSAGQEMVNSLLSYNDTLGKGQQTVDSSGRTETVSANKSMNDALSMSKQFAQENGFDHVKTMKAFAGLPFGVGVNGEMSDADRKILRSVQDSGLQQQFSEHFEKGLQHMEDHKGSLTNHADKQLVENIQSSHSRMNSFQEMAQKSLTDSQGYREAAQLAETNSLSVSRQLDDDFIQYVADKRFNGNVGSVGSFSKEDKPQFEQDRTEFLSSRKNEIMSDLKSQAQAKGIQFGESGIRSSYVSSSKPSVSSAPLGGDQQVRNHARSQGLDDSFEKNINSKVESYQQQYRDRVKEGDQKLSGQKQTLQNDRQTKRHDFDSRQQKGLSQTFGDNVSKVINDPWKEYTADSEKMAAPPQSSYYPTPPKVKS